MEAPPEKSPAKPRGVPRYDYVDFSWVVDLHPSVREMLKRRPAEYSPDLSAIHPKVLDDLMRTHPLGVIPLRDQQDRFHCITGIRLYRRLGTLKSRRGVVPVLIFENLTLTAISAMSLGDYYFAPYLVGPPASARHAHAAVWAETQAAGKLSLETKLTGQAILAAMHDIDERPFNGKIKTHVLDSE